MKLTITDRVDAASLGSVMFCMIKAARVEDEPSSVIFVNRHNEWFLTPPMRGPKRVVQILRAFPFANHCYYSLDPRHCQIAGGLHYVKLGFDKHLLVSDDVYDAFMQQVENLHSAAPIGETWVTCASAALTDFLGDSNLPQKVVLEAYQGNLVLVKNPDREDSQTLSIDADGLVEFTSKGPDDEILSYKRTRIDRNHAKELLARLHTLAVVSLPQRYEIYDADSWNMQIIMNDGTVCETSNNHKTIREQLKIAKELRELFPRQPVAPFNLPDDANDRFDDLGEEDWVYNTTYGYGRIHRLKGDMLKVAFSSGIQQYKFPDAFAQKLIVRDWMADECTDPFSTVTSIRLEKICTFRPIRTEQYTVYRNKAKGKINYFGRNDSFISTASFDATPVLRDYLFDLVTAIDQERLWRPVYDAGIIDGNSIKLTITYSTGHCKHVEDHVLSIPYMEQIDGLIRLMATPLLDRRLCEDDEESCHYIKWFEEFNYAITNCDPLTFGYAWPLAIDAPEMAKSEYKRDILEGFGVNP